MCERLQLGRESRRIPDFDGIREAAHILHGDTRQTVDKVTRRLRMSMASTSTSARTVSPGRTGARNAMF